MPPTSPPSVESTRRPPPTPIPEVDGTPHLSTRTLGWLAHRPRDRDLVSSVWDTLTELEQAGQQPGGPIAALRSGVRRTPQAGLRAAPELARPAR